MAIEADIDRERALKFIKEKNLTFHFLENGEGENEIVRKTFKVNGLPVTLVLNHDGKVMYFHTGWGDGSEVELEKEIIKLLAEGAGSGV